MKSFFSALFLVGVCMSSWSLSEASLGIEPGLYSGLFYSVDSYGPDWLNDDQNGDGIIDYVVFLNEELDRVFEALDTNGDGLMDDFYIYQNDVLVRRELDRDYDGKVDLWLHMHEGVYVLGWELDNDGDGKIDEYKAFGI